MLMVIVSNVERGANVSQWTAQFFQAPGGYANAYCDHFDIGERSYVSMDGTGVFELRRIDSTSLGNLSILRGSVYLDGPQVLFDTRKAQECLLRSLRD